MKDVSRGDVSLERGVFGHYVVGLEHDEKADLGDDYEIARENAVDMVKCLVKFFEIGLEDLV